MTGSVPRTLIFAAICCSALPAISQNRPAFCESIPDALLGGLAAPYARQVAPDGSAYCEGLLRNPIALQPPSVISLKQDQSADTRFQKGQTANLTWCADAGDSIHVRLRSISIPLFALDAVHANHFEWRSDLVAQWQPDWKNLAALGSRDVLIGGHSYRVLLPLRSGTGYSSIYSFTVQSKLPIHLTSALLEPLDSTGTPSLVSVSFSGGPSKDTWTTTIPFTKMQNGVYRITFEEGIEDAGATTDPIYLFHKTCGDR